MKPARQRIAGHCLRSPSVTSVAGLATTILASSSAMMPRKSPTPAEIANLRFFGMELMMYSRILNTEMRKNSTPEQNTPASACCQVYLWASTTVNAKNALSPMAGDELGADIAAALAQAEIAIEKRSLARRLGCVGHVTPPPD